MNERSDRPAPHEGSDGDLESEPTEKARGSACPFHDGSRTGSDERESADPNSTGTESENDTVDVGAPIWDVEYEKRRCGWTRSERRLVALKVEEYDAMRSELTRRGIGVGALYHKTVEEVA
jgi:hypothetical protein